MWVLAFIAKNALSTMLNSRMSAGTHIVPAVALENTVELTTQKNLSRSNSEVANYLLIEFSNDQEIVKMDSAILRCTQPANMTPMLQKAFFTFQKNVLKKTLILFIFWALFILQILQLETN